MVCIFLYILLPKHENISYMDGPRRRGRPLLSSSYVVNLFVCVGVVFVYRLFTQKCPRQIFAIYR